MRKEQRSGWIMRILLVEDDLQICEVTKKYFESKGAEIVAVNNGADALAVVEDGLAGYSLVLLDIMLPGADGFAVCRSIRRHSDIPVIFLTARGLEEIFFTAMSSAVTTTS